MILLGAFTLNHHRAVRAQSQAQALKAGATTQPTPKVNVDLPPLDEKIEEAGGIARLLTLKTLIPERPNHKVLEYTVQAGDSPWSIANRFELQPESILWANTDLNSSAGSLKPGMVLNIPPVDGVIHTALEGDTLEDIQAMHGSTVQEIFEYPGNEFDLTQPPKLRTGQQVIIPNGISPISWQEAGPNMGVVSGAVASAIPLVMTGTGIFLWPIAPPFIITHPYWSGHYGIDLDTYPRQPVFASDSGTVIFSGWDDTGYGYFVVVDHGNGYQTTYGHNAANLVSQGQGVLQGQQVAESGNTGNSTGDHLDFRILYNGTALDPAGILR